MEIFSLESGGPGKKYFPFSSSDVRIVNARGFLPITGMEVVKVVIVSL